MHAFIWHAVRMYNFLEIYIAIKFARARIINKLNYFHHEIKSILYYLCPIYFFLYLNYKLYGSSELQKNVSNSDNFDFKLILFR